MSYGYGSSQDTHPAASFYDPHTIRITCRRADLGREACSCPMGLPSGMGMRQPVVVRMFTNPMILLA